MNNRRFTTVEFVAAVSAVALAVTDAGNVCTRFVADARELTDVTHCHETTTDSASSMLFHCQTNRTLSAIFDSRT